MTTIKDYPRIKLGSSDIASLMVRTPEGVSILHIGIDGDYVGRVVDGECEILDGYKLAITGTSWAWIYDDDGLVSSISADRISIYTNSTTEIIIKKESKNEPS